VGTELCSWEEPRPVHGKSCVSEVKFQRANLRCDAGQVMLARCSQEALLPLCIGDGDGDADAVHMLHHLLRSKVKEPPGPAPIVSQTAVGA